jgi:multimeric flavodoxin WrbA
MKRLRALFLVGTLKSGSDASKNSNTYALSEFLAKHLDSNGVQSDLIPLADHNILPGVYTNIENDDWPMIFEKILASDIVIFATPVWWGNQSSLIQRVIERLDEVHDDIMKSGKSKMTNKVAGIVVTGDSDGAEHIIGNLANFFIALGFTVPPFGTLTVLWSGLRKHSDKSKEEILKYYEDTYSSTAKKAAQRLSFMATLLKQNNFPD